jgi:hypothetical protein
LVGKAYRDTGSAVLSAVVEVGFAESDEVVRLDENENRSDVDDRVPMLNHVAVEIGQQRFRNGQFIRQAIYQTHCRRHD